jgi:hypothetical protein
MPSKPFALDVQNPTPAKVFEILDPRIRGGWYHRRGRCDPKTCMFCFVEVLWGLPKMGSQ